MQQGENVYKTHMNMTHHKENTIKTYWHLIKSTQDSASQNMSKKENHSAIKKKINNNKTHLKKYITSENL